MNSGNFSVSLPKEPNGNQETYTISSEVFHQASQVLQEAKKSNLILNPGIKFCRTAPKQENNKRERIKVLDIKPQGCSQILGSIESIDLSQSLFIHHPPEQLTSPDASSSGQGSDNLGVYLLCESKPASKSNAPGIGYRNRARRMNDSETVNCVVKYMLYLGTAKDLIESVEPVIPLPAQWAVYKRRVYDYNFIQKIDKTLGTSKKPHNVGLYLDGKTVYWLQDGEIKQASLDITKMSNDSDLKKFIDNGQEPRLLSESAISAIGEIKRIVKDIPRESDHSSAEVMPYVGPSLSHIAKGKNILLSEKIKMCSEFFQYIASEYSNNPSLGFHDIKPDNFSYDIHGTKKCTQNDKKARHNPNIHTERYVAPWMLKNPENNKLTLDEKFTSARDLYAMGKTIETIVELHNESQQTATTSRRIPVSEVTKKLQILYLKKIANDMIAHARDNHENADLKNEDYIRETIVPALKHADTEDNILFMSAVSFLKEQKINISPDNIKNENKPTFTSAVFGAKAYLDQHQAKNDKTKGKTTVTTFLQTIATIDASANKEQYRDQINKAISDSTKASRFFSKKSRRQVFNTYCPFFAGNESSTQLSQTQHIHEATQIRISKLVRFEEPEAFDRAMTAFLSNDKESLRFKVLEKAIQYLESEKSGRFGRKTVKKLIKDLFDNESHGTSDDFINRELTQAIRARGLFSRKNKMRKEFFEPLLSPPAQ